MTKISELPQVTTPQPTDLVLISDQPDRITKSTTIKSMLDNIRAVGSIFISVSPDNPETIFGGTWVSYGKGRTIIGIDGSDSNLDSPELISGAKTHVLSTAELPAHQHLQYVTHTGSQSGVRRDWSSDVSASTYTQGTTTYSTGSSSAHNNLQPYITTYFWKRTA